jgi:hypothetical protein
MCLPGEHLAATKLLPFTCFASVPSGGRVEMNCKTLIQYGSCTTDKDNCVGSAEKGHTNRIYCYSVIAKQMLQMMHLFKLNIFELVDCARISLD